MAVGLLLALVACFHWGEEVAAAAVFGGVTALCIWVVVRPRGLAERLDGPPVPGPLRWSALLRLLGILVAALAAGATLSAAFDLRP